MEKYKNKYRTQSFRFPAWDYGSAGMYFITICTQNRTCFFGKIADDEMQLSPIGQIVQTEWLKTFAMRPDMHLFMGEFVVMPNHFHAVIGIGQNQYNTPQPDAMGNGIRVATNNGAGISVGRGAMHCTSNETGQVTNNDGAGISVGRGAMHCTSNETGRVTNNDGAGISEGGAIHCTSTIGNGNTTGDGAIANAGVQYHIIDTIIPLMDGTDDDFVLQPINYPIKTKNKFGPQSKNLASVVRGFKSAVTMAARRIDPNFQWQSLYHDHIIRNNESYGRISDYIINNPLKWQEDRFFDTIKK